MRLESRSQCPRLQLLLEVDTKAEEGLRAQARACTVSPRIRAHAIAHGCARAASIESPKAPEVEHAPYQVVQRGLAQVPEGLITTHVLQDTLVCIMGFFESMDQEGEIPMAQLHLMLEGKSRSQLHSFQSSVLLCFRLQEFHLMGVFSLLLRHDQWLGLLCMLWSREGWTSSRIYIHHTLRVIPKRMPRTSQTNVTRFYAIWALWSPMELTSLLFS